VISNQQVATTPETRFKAVHWRLHRGGNKPHVSHQVLKVPASVCMQSASIFVLEVRRLRYDVASGARWGGHAADKIV